MRSPELNAAHAQLRHAGLDPASTYLKTGDEGPEKIDAGSSPA
jgi:hypothetical protein